MPGDSRLPWESLERYSARMFLLGAVLLAVNAAIVLYGIVEGTGLRAVLGQVFVGSGWTAVFVGMLGLYPRLADRSSRLALGCALLAGIGILGYSVMTVVYLAGVAGLPESTLQSLTPVFLPFVGVSSLLAFPLFAVTSLQTGAFSRGVSVLLATPTVIFVSNVATGATPESIFVVLVALVLVYGAIGYLVRTEGRSAEQVLPPKDTTV